MTSEGDACTPSAVIDRISLVLDAFDGPGRLWLAQVVRRTGLPRSSAHRMLERLVQLRWLRRHGRDYELGMRLVELGSLAVHQDRLHSAAQQYLHELHRATGLVVHMAVLDGADVVYLEKIAGGSGRRFPPASVVANPRTALRSARHCWRSPIQPRWTPSTWTCWPVRPDTRFPPSPADRSTTAIRARGFAYERAESVGRIRLCRRADRRLAAPIAAVSVCGPFDRMAFDHRLAAPVRMHRLGHLAQLRRRRRDPRAAGPPTAPVAPRAARCNTREPRPGDRRAAARAEPRVPARGDHDRTAAACRDRRTSSTAAESRAGR